MTWISLNSFKVTWSRVTFINATQKLNNLLFVDLLKYTPLSRYHTTHMIERDNIEYWNLEIRNVHTSDQGYYSCVLTAIKPISKLFHVKVVGMYSVRMNSNNRKLMITIIIKSLELWIDTSLQGFSIVLLIMILINRMIAFFSRLSFC